MLHGLPQSRADRIEDVAGFACFRRFKQDRISDAQLVTAPKLVQMQPGSGDVFAKRPRREAKLYQGLLFDQQHLATAAGPTMSAAFEPSISDGGHLKLLRHGGVPSGCNEQSSDFGHGLIPTGTSLVGHPNVAAVMLTIEVDLTDSLIGGLASSLKCRS